LQDDMIRLSIEKSLRQPVIPVVWDPTKSAASLSQASAVFLQGGSLADLQRTLEKFQHPELAGISVFAHIDLIAGLENSEAGLEYLADLGRLAGVVTVHHHLTKPARRLGLLSVVRLFLSDSRSVERGVSIASKSQADAIEILPAAAAVKVAADLNKCGIPRITGGLCRTEADVREALDSGCRAVTSTRAALWQLNA
jgi:glycerol uptake operon antiterminator